MKIYNNQSLENSLNIKSVSKFFIEINNQDDFNYLYDFIKKENLPVLIIGEGTNLVLPDKFNGIAVKPIFNEISIKIII